MNHYMIVVKGIPQVYRICPKDIDAALDEMFDRRIAFSVKPDYSVDPSFHCCICDLIRDLQ